MFERYCPTIRGTCRDGNVDDSKYLCAFWDSFSEECIFAESLLANCGKLLNAFQARDDGLDNILRRVNDLSAQVQALATKEK